MICRLCLTDMLDVINIFDENGKNINVNKIISKHFWFEPKLDDPISTVVCKPCWSTIEYFHRFYLKIEEAHLLLSERFSVKIDAEEMEESSSPTHQTESPNDLESIEVLSKNASRQSEEYENEDECLEWLDQRTQTTCTESENEGDNEQLEVEQCLNVRVTRSSTFVKSNSGSQINVLTKSMKKDIKLANCNTLEKVKIETDSIEKKCSKYTKLSKEYDEKIAKHMKLTCDICHLEIPTFGGVKQHFRTVHSQLGYIVCCNKKIFKRVLLVDHINKHLDPDYFRCHDCNKSFADKQCLKNHMLILHQAEEEKIYHCTECSKRFAKKYLLVQHKAVHTPVGERKCFCECGKAFPNSSLLNTHKKYVHSSVYSKMCDICAKVIRGKTAFEKHQLEHDGIKQPEVQCEKCGAWLKDKYSLQKHVRRHNDDGIVHSCDLCGKIAPNQSALRSHFRYVHAAERSYKCSICDKAFKKPIILKEHMTTHTGEVLYSCPHCPRTFNSNANMHSHRKKAHRIEWEQNRKFQKGKVIATKLVKVEPCIEMINDSSNEQS